MYVFVTLKFVFFKKKKKFRLQNLQEFFQIERLLSRKKQKNRTSFKTCKKGFAFFSQKVKKAKNFFLT
ncbi:hypothetical protein HT031_006982 (chloroplast) [Scenedesmus sp. PABB004]|nr:hypothetical protein HT031_006982 [Scenedesmus sp. PABB004]